MKSLLFAATAILFLAAANPAPAPASGPRASGGNAWAGVPATGMPHYEWQYGYVGHHPRYQGHRVLAR